MPTWEIRREGKTYEVRAPDQETLIKGLTQYGSQPEATPEKKPDPNALTRLKDWWMKQPSFAQQVGEQTQKDIAAFQKGGTKELLKDTTKTQELMSGFGMEGGIAKPRPPKLPKVAVPTQEELATVTTGAGQGYKGGVMEVPLKEHVLPDIQKNVLDDLHSQHFREYGAPFVWRAVKELEAVEGKTPTVADIETVRQVLNRAPFDQRAAAQVAKNKINDYLSEIQPHDTTLGENVGAVLNDIRGNYSALKKSEMITDAAERGHRAAETSGMGANLDNALRQQVKRIRNNPKLMRGMPDEVVKEMDRVIKGSKVANLARMFSRFGPQHPLTGWGFAALEGLRSGSLKAIALLGGGHIAQKIAEGSTKRGIQRIDELIRSQSPLFRERGGGAVPPKLPLLESPVMQALQRGGVAATGPAIEANPYLQQQGLQ